MRFATPQPVIKPRRRHQQRHAFTLLEVVFALGLSLVLLAAMLSAIDLYRQVSTAGREDVEQSQLARTILRSFEIDIRSVMFNPPPVEEDEADADSTDDESVEEPAEEVVVESVDAAEALAGQSGGIFGDATTLVIHAGRPPRKLESLLLTEPVSDLKSISYFLATPGAEGLPGVAGSLVDDTSTNGQPRGLARLEGDRMAIEFADAAGDLQLLAAQTRLLAPEIDFLQFRYSDGLSWLDAWDTAAYERLPNAIEITLGINSQSDTDTSTTIAQPRPSRLYRFVVAIPSATPYIETTTEDGM